MNPQQPSDTIIDIGALDPKAQEDFLAEIGDVVFDAALLRLIEGLTQEQGLALDHYLEDEPSLEVLMKHLVDHYPQFEKILDEEVAVMKEEIASLTSHLDDTKN